MIPSKDQNPPPLKHHPPSYSRLLLALKRLLTLPLQPPHKVRNPHTIHAPHLPHAADCDACREVCDQLDTLILPLGLGTALSVPFTAATEDVGGFEDVFGEWGPGVRLAEEIFDSPRGDDVFTVAEIAVVFVQVGGALDS